MDSSASHSISRSFVYTLAFHSLFFMGALTNIRTRMITEEKSAFEINGNGVILIIAIAALLAVEVTSLILFWTNILSSYYACLKSIGIFSATLAPYSLTTVMGIPFEQNSMAYLLFCVIYGFVLAYAFSGNDDYDRSLNKSSYVSVLTYFGLFLVPLTLLLVLFVPKNLNWLVDSLMYPTLAIEAVCFLTVFFKFLIIEGVQQNFLEIQQDKKKKAQEDKKNTDLEAQHDNHFFTGM